MAKKSIEISSDKLIELIALSSLISVIFVTSIAVAIVFELFREIF